MAKWDLEKLDKEAKPSPTYADRMDKVESLFRFAHLPEHLQAASKPFHDLAVHLTDTLPPSAEYTLALRSLWEAKNLAVFAAVEAAEGE
ncbi:hypothetical protein RDp07_gp22 [Roseobacter phage RD-1410Ws-07]|uniref:Uncharacterized protein n=2 Tax=Sanyabayvirus DS1410Ws06 TaxID=2844087 RepID=A0A191VYP9_9CAUD|nr:hypothetical protein HYO98_gp25 [Dinoroseobacter phage DS-1410Ws-06]ANJ20682.1 hypothetical protein DSp06_gp25 [Dinoroseobacter phage DS-1410Ws-06]ANJ20833.1 hypothetical protein RDp07_gp22 [Roseobacter phage RD-1410Ws-07]